MLGRLGSLLTSAVSAIGRGIDSALGAVAGAVLIAVDSALGAVAGAVLIAVDSALGAVAGAVLSAATALAPKAPPSSPQFGGSPDLGVCPGGKDWRGPFPTAVDAHEYRLDIPVTTSIHQYADGWWVYIEYGMPEEADDDEPD